MLFVLPLFCCDDCFTREHKVCHWVLNGRKAVACTRWKKNGLTKSNKNKNKTWESESQDRVQTADERHTSFFQRRVVCRLRVAQFWSFGLYSSSLLVNWWLKLLFDLTAPSTNWGEAYDFSDSIFDLMTNISERSNQHPIALPRKKNQWRTRRWREAR